MPAVFHLPWPNRHHRKANCCEIRWPGGEQGEGTLAGEWAGDGSSEAAENNRPWGFCCEHLFPIAFQYVNRCQQECPTPLPLCPKSTRSARGKNGIAPGRNAVPNLCSPLTPYMHSLLRLLLNLGLMMHNITAHTKKCAKRNAMHVIGDSRMALCGPYSWEPNG